MLESLFGSINRERALAYLVANPEGYARGIAAFFDVNLRSIQLQLQLQLDNLESGGVLVSRTEGRTRLYCFNPRWPPRDPARHAGPRLQRNDRQSLYQAILVARTQAVDLDEIRRWARREGKADAFSRFLAKAGD